MTSNEPVGIDAKVKRSLDGTAFEPVVLKKLSGGSVNWIYLAKLPEREDHEVEAVLVKHGETHMASKPEFPLTLLRCRIEVEALRNLSGSSSFSGPHSKSDHIFEVRTPQFHHFDEKNTNQIHEYLPNGIDLKEYVLRHYSAPTPDALRPQCRQLGAALGGWLRGFAAWGARQAELRRTVAENTFAQDVKYMLNFAWLDDRVKAFPDVLGGVGDVLGQVQQMAIAERQDEAGQQIIHGDFWTGNIILPNDMIQAGKKVPIFVVDWECTQLGLPSVDFGQVIAEMYALWLYKSTAAGLWMLQGFVAAYGAVSDDFAFRTAIQVGTHLLCITTTFPGWGTPEQVDEVARVGRDVIVHAWQRDRAWFEGGDLACLFGC